ncbi:dihydrolipoyl dehydrogenase (plasmid) [Halococcus dombrowskii]|uniref:Dihydrolipoyl dehydrogenase n=2 Tax=Halococcus dombrowskii TaxID=179637 RepID=A0AAX3ATI5_HALDO|nr:dihydrolipoyl dehydrogenase [Halococcus dombrowskii]UOO97000.1 dihydrolipoyl dehydrogenase [Halococcus dombrowskii]
MVADGTIQTDVLVIGAGPGGYVSAIRLGQLGLDVALVERDNYGGVCLNHGCIPSKALISTTNLAHDARNAQERGINAEVSINTERMIEWKDDIVKQLTGGVEQLCRANGVELIRGTGKFVNDSEARVISDGSNAPSHIAFDHAVIATGSRSMPLPGFNFDDEPILNSREALSLEAAPEDLLIVGAGYIGLELATVFAKLGTDVTVVEMLDKILPGFENDVTSVVRQRTEELNIDLHLGEAAQEWTRTDRGTQVTTETETDNFQQYNTEKVLVAIGREPVLDSLELENVGLESNDEGFLTTNKQGRTEVESIYAIGDVAGEPMLAHKASKEGIIAAQVIAGEPIDPDYRFVPAAVFTDPEIGTVGMTQAEAENAGITPLVGKMPFSASGRAMTMGDPTGFVRIVAIKESGVLIGAQIVGPDASKIIAELSFAIEQGATLDDIAETIHIHPTLTEAVMEAAENAMGQAIHTTN